MDMSTWYLQAGLAAVGGVFSLLWIFLYLKYGSKFKEYIVAVDTSQYLGRSIFFIGYGAVELFHFDLYGERAQAKKKLMAELYETDYVPFHYYTKIAAQFTYVLTLIPLSCLISAISGSVEVAVIGILVAVVFAVYFDEDIKSKVNTRHENMMADYPHMLSKLALLINAGLPLQEALKKTVEGKRGELYDVINDALQAMENGVPLILALKEMTDHADIPELKKFGTIVVQNMEKGSAGLGERLLEVSGGVWLERKSYARQMGEAASSKLMIPTMMIFLGILIMVIVPMFTSMNF